MLTVDPTQKKETSAEQRIAEKVFKNAFQNTPLESMLRPPQREPEGGPWPSKTEEE